MPRVREPKKGALAKGQEAPPRTDKELTSELDQLEKDIKEIRALYELYFRGVEKIEPVPQRDLIKAQIRGYQRERITNTAMKYRIQQFKARMIALENYWERTNRLRESGKYRPDAVRIARREAERQRKEAALASTAEASSASATSGAPTEVGAPPVPSGRPITGAALYAGRSAAETAGGAASPKTRSAADMSRPSAQSADDLTEDKLRRLYDTYVGARKRCGEKVDLRFEDMAAALRKQVPKLMSETGAKSVEFKVVIRDGRAVLKALPKGQAGKGEKSTKPQT